MNIADLIASCGGARAISEASQHTDHPVKLHAVYKWIERGSVPTEHWPLIMNLSGATLDTVYRASTVAA